MLLLITVGAQSAWADDITYADVNGVTYALYPDFYGGDYAYMVNVVGTNEVKTIVVPERINSNGKTYFVAGVREPNYSGSSNITTSTMADWSGKVETLIFEGSIQIPASGYTQPAFSCQSLKDIYFLQSTPEFDQGAYNDYFNINMTPKNTITLHVVDKTAAQIATLKTQEVFKDFKDIVACDGLNPVQPVNAITFKDDAVKAICVANWDTDGDGELSYEEAAAVTSIGTKFKNNTTITSFDELQYFGLTSLEQYAFNGCTNLETIVLPESLTHISSDVFYDCSSLKTLFIPKNVTTMLNGITQNCTRLALIEVDEANTKYDSRNNCNAIIEKESGRLVAGCKYTTIPEGVGIIGAESMYGLPIKSIVIPSTVTELQTNCFARCTDLLTVEMKATTPPELKRNAFSTALATQCKLIVPAGSLKAYRDYTPENPNQAKSYVQTFKSIEPPVYDVITCTIANEDVPNVEYVVDGGTPSVIFGYKKLDFDDDDRATISTVELKVKIDNNDRPILVLHNGEDVSYSPKRIEEDENDNAFFIYDISLSESETWDISYDTSHRQTVIVNGGTALASGDVGEWNYEFINDEKFKYFTPNSFATFDLPPHDAQNNTYMSLTFFVKEDESFKAKRNGVPVKFVEGTTSGGQRYFTLDVNDGDYPNFNTQNALGFQILDSAVWEITIEDASKMLNAYANNDVEIWFAKLVDGEQPSYGGQDNAMHRWVNEGETYEVRFIPKHGEELTRFDIGWNSITIADENRLVKNADGSYSFTISYDEMNEERFDIMAVFSGGTNDENAVEYMFIGDFVRVDVSADYNGNVPYDGYMFTKDNVEGFYIDRVIENGTAVNQEASIEFQLPNENATCRVFRNGVDMTTSFSKGVEGWYNLIGNDAWMHEPAHWVIINESDLMKYDVNRDDKINVTDVTTLVNKILHP